MGYSKDNHSKVGFELLDEVLNWERINESNKISFTKKLQDNIDDFIFYGYVFQFIDEGSLIYFSVSNKPNIVYVYNCDTNEIKPIAGYVGE